MTLVLAIDCENGVVIASDSAVTDATGGTKQPGEKMKRMRDWPILYGIAGDYGLVHKLAEALES